MEIEIAMLEKHRKLKDKAFIYALFGIDGLYLNGFKAIPRTIAIIMGFFLVYGYIWVIVNMITICDRVDEHNRRIDDKIDNLEDDIDELLAKGVK